MTPPKRCLLLIDLQNEFLSRDGNFPINKESQGFLDKLPELSSPFRVSKQPIFWIRSEYENPHLSGEVKGRDDNMTWKGTHSGNTPCCEKGSIGADFPDEVAALIAESESDLAADNVVITKTWYSAFKDTSLFTELREREITDLYIGGLLTNACIRATVLDARDLGFEVTLVEDCLGWRNRLSHDRALEQMLKRGTQIVSSNDLDTKRGNTIHFPQLFYVNGSIPSWRVMMALYEKNIEFHPTRLLVMSKPKDTRLPEFLALNHRGKAPVFVDLLPQMSTSETAEEAESETVTINESLAILQYIETYYKPDCPLLPPFSERGLRAIALARIQESENLRLAYDALEHEHFEAEHSGGKLNDTERADLIEAVNEELDYWEVYAAKTSFIAGASFGLADCALFPCLAYMVYRGFEWRRRQWNTPDTFEEVDSWPSLKAYFQRVWDRGGRDGCAQKAHPTGWERKRKVNIWKGTKGT